MKSEGETSGVRPAAQTGVGGGRAEGGVGRVAQRTEDCALAVANLHLPVQAPAALHHLLRPGVDSEHTRHRPAEGISGVRWTSGSSGEMSTSTSTSTSTSSSGGSHEAPFL